MCMSMYHVHSAQGGQKRASDPETGVTDSCEQPYWCWELNMVLLEEQSMFLTPEPSLQPLCHFVQWCWHFHKMAVMRSVPPASTHRLQTLRGDPLFLEWYVFFNESSLGSHPFPNSFIPTPCILY